jgi:dihydrofolate reductase
MLQNLRFPGGCVRELTADLFISLDGFASGMNELPLFGYHGEDLVAWIRENLEKPQMLIMGRVTYAALAHFAIASNDELNVRMTALPKVVFSKTLQEPATWKNTRLVRTSVEEEISRLKHEHGEPLRSIGSISLVKSMITSQLVDRLRLMIFPVVLGTAGREFIYSGYERTRFALMDSRILDSCITLLEYKPRTRNQPV